MAGAIAAVLLVAGFLAARPQSSDAKKSKADKDATTKLHIFVLNPDGKPVENASVYVRYESEGDLLHLHHGKKTEMNFKTNQEGTCKTPDLPRRKVLIQVIASGWKTYGKYYDLDQDEQTITIKLDRPPKWY